MGVCILVQSKAGIRYRVLRGGHAIKDMYIIEQQITRRFRYKRIAIECTYVDAVKYLSGIQGVAI